MHLYISVSYFLCAVSLTHSLGLFKPHLAQHKYIINRHLHWMPLKLESFSHETTCLLATVISYCECARDCDVSACTTVIKGSARNRQDVKLPVAGPGRSCEKYAPLAITDGKTWDSHFHARNWPIPTSGRSISASLLITDEESVWGNQFENNHF